MVYRYYIKRGSKRFGPYYYRSYRENGKFKKEYLGTSLPKEYRKTNKLLLILILGLIGLAILGSALGPTITSFVIREKAYQTSLIQKQAEINKPVKWQETIALTDKAVAEEELVIKIPKYAYNIKVDGKEDVKTTKENWLLAFLKKAATITGFAVQEQQNLIINVTELNVTIKPIAETIEVNITKNVTEINISEVNITNITEEIVGINLSEVNITNITVNNVTKEVINITNITEANITEEITNETINITEIIEENITEVPEEEIPEEEIEEEEIEEVPEIQEIQIEYETPGPKIREEQITPYKKRVTVYSDIHYENVLAYTNIPELTHKESAIKVYHIVNGNRELVEEVEYFDENNNGLIDKLQWVVPSLSEQEYEVVIEISKAQHLDENKQFISDIYERVYQLDNVWSEPIYHNEYVRVTFKRNLTSDRDITIYPRVINGNPKIEVYEFEGNEKIAELTSINSNKYNKVYLTNLISESQDAFDLRILGGTIEIDHIVDPAEDWYTPVAIHSRCGELDYAPASYLIDDNLDSYWQHDVAEDHWVIFDMGETYTVKKVRCYHQAYWHWTELGGVYVSDDLENWGDSLGSSTANWYSDATGWEEIDTTDKDGRYIKIVGNAQDTMGFFEFDIYGEAGAAPPPPTYSLNSTNSTLAGTSVSHNLYWEDDLGLSGYIFSFCNGTYTGTAQNIAYYNLTNTTNNKAYWASPAGRNPWGGTEATAAQYTNMSSDDGTYAEVHADATNDEPYWRFNFTIKEAIASIQWINTTFNGYENAAETATCYVYNHTSNAWISIGVVPNSDGQISKNFTNGFNQIIGNGSQLIIYCEGADYDDTSPPWDSIFTDFVEVKVGYIVETTQPCSDANAVLTNDTWVSMTGLTNWSNVTKTITSEVGATIKWCVYANDTSNKWNGTSCVTPFSYVTTLPTDNPPTVTLNSPANGSNLSSASVTFNCSVSDDNGIINVSLYGNWTGSWTLNETNSSGTNNAAYIFTKTIPEGTHKWNCEACDTASQCAFASANRTFTVDTTAPTWSNNKTNATNPATGQSVYFNVTFTDTNPGRYIFAINQTGNWVNYTGTYTSGVPIQNITTVTASAGAFVSWYFWANDTAGNSNQTYVWNFTVAVADNPPNVTLSSPANASTEPDGNITFQCNVTDDAAILNISLYTNSTGTWHMNQTIISSGWYTPTAIYNKCEQNDWDPATDMIDDNTSTPWSSSTTHNHSVAFDMGKTYSISKVRIYHVQFMTNLRVHAIYVSDDPTNWGSSLGETSAGVNYYYNSSGWDEIDITDKSGRYINLTSSNGSGIYWYEFDAYVEGIPAGTKSYNASFNVTGLSSGSYIWNCLAYDNDSNSDWGDANWTVNVLADAYPTWSNNGTNASNATKTQQSVYFNVTLTDDVGGGYYKFAFYNGSAWSNTTPLTWTSPQNIQNITTITATRGMIVKWYWWFNDSIGQANQTDVWNFTVANTAPTQVTLDAPANNNITTNRTPTFSWNQVTDADGDSINYTILINCSDNGEQCTLDDREANLVGISNTSYVPSSDLKLFGDDNYYYNWSVRAYDGYDYGAWSSERKITINSLVDIVLSPNNINFGSLSLGQSNDTTDDIPAPFVIRNDGNCYINISLSSNNFLWSSQTAASKYFQFKIDNVTGEAGAFNSSASQVSWKNISTSNLTAIVSLNYSDAKDSAEIDINVEVPLDEPAGARGSIITLTGSYSSS